MPEQPRVASELTRHSKALRSLARDLVGTSDADDLVQETALRALRSPPSGPGGLFAWLTTIMRNLAANRRRGELRRQRCHAGRGAGDGALSAGDEAAHRDSVRAVTDALWSLPEPYQGTLVQRYFQDLSPSQIAERSGTPLPTVKSRLQRGLDLLRASLARRDGRDWRAALAPAFGLRGGPAWWVSLFTVSSMSTLSKSAAVLAACALAALSWWVLGPAGAPPSPVAALGAAESAPALVAADDARATASREQVAAADAAPELAQPFAFELRCRVVDADGLPIRGAQVALAPPACALALWPQETGEDGAVVVTWRARAATLVMAVGLVHDGANTSLQQVATTAGEPAHVHFVAGLAPLPASVRLDELGRQIVTMPDCSQGRADCRSCHEGQPVLDLFAIRGILRAGLHPDAAFGDRLVAPLRDMQAVGFDDFGPELDLGRTHTAGSITGRLFGADGTPVRGVTVAALQAARLVRGRTRADGSFDLPWPATTGGAVLVRAGGGPEGQVAFAVEATSDRTSAGDLILQTGRTLRGHARGADGRNLNGARVEYVAPPGHAGDAATVGPDGRFAFANLPPGPGRLLLWGVHGEKLPIADLDPVLPDGGDVEFDLRTRAPANGSLRVCVRTHDGATPTDIEIRAWQQQTNRGAFLDKREDGQFHAHGLAAGFYRVEVGTLASGFRDLGGHWVDGTGLADLGWVQLPRPGRLRIDATPDVGGLELYARRQDLDVRADVIGPGSRELQLPAGRWLALWKRDGTPQAREVTLIAGGDTELRIPR